MKLHSYFLLSFLRVLSAFAPVPRLYQVTTIHRYGSILFTPQDRDGIEGSDSVEEINNLRFGGVSRLYGPHNLSRLQRSHVAIVGVGGVGCWTAESLCRSGVGAITLIDLDELCISNSNRQLHAMVGTVGRRKTAVLAERLRCINPSCVVQELTDFVTPENVDEIVDRIHREDWNKFGAEVSELRGQFVIVDAIDNVHDKAALLVACRQRTIPFVTVGGAGGKRDPTRVRIADITGATNDMLLRQVRKLLRREYGFPRESKGSEKRLHHKRNAISNMHIKAGELRSGQPWGVACVYSDEKALSAILDASSNGLLGCDGAFGTACSVTGTFGFVAASAVIDLLLLPEKHKLEPKRCSAESGTSLAEFEGLEEAEGDAWEMDCPCSDFGN